MHLGHTDDSSAPESDPKEEGLKKALESEKAEWVLLYARGRVRGRVRGHVRGHVRGGICICEGCVTYYNTDLQR